jgi:sugar phosphate isomerase/epimerase
METRTGGFPIGFRRGRWDWQSDLDHLTDWTKQHDLSVIDVGRDGDVAAGPVIGAGLRVGSVDLLEWQGMISADAEERAEAVERNAAYIQACAANGPTSFFLVMLPQDPELPREENFGYMVNSFRELVPVLEANDSRLVIEGWPGPGALCCTPETFRAFFREVPSPSMGINYDPSHLIRMGIDPIRFLQEFVDRVYHIHGKDTEILTEALYEYGHEQPATFAEKIRYGAYTWRYTIPGHGCMRWVEAFDILDDAGYEGAVCIELEDANFTTDEAASQMGILQGAEFLRGC